MLQAYAPQMVRDEQSEPATATIIQDLGTVIEDPGSTNTKHTTWTQLISSTAFETSLVVVVLQHQTLAAATGILVDIGIGAASSESVIIPDLLGGAIWGGRHYIFPLRIPAGSRLSARMQAATTGQDVRVWVQLYGGDRFPSQKAGEKVTAYGINSSTSQGVDIIPGTASDGTWVSIGTTSEDHWCLVPGIQLNDSAITAGSLVWKWGIDTSSTSVIRESYHSRADGAERIHQQNPWFPMFRKVKSGSVIACSGRGASVSDTYAVAFYGVS